MTDNNDHPRSKLPPALQEAARQLKSVELPEGFHARLAGALVEADQTGWRPNAQPRRTRTAWMRAGGPWLAFVPGAAGMALMLHLAFGGGDEAEAEAEIWHQAQSQEVELVLDATGHSWVNLDLLTHHHDGQQAIVRVDAPHDVRVMAPEHAEHEVDSPICAAQRCVHEYSQPTHDDNAPALQVGVAEPGRYRISVEHASSGTRVREEFVVLARR